MLTSIILREILDSRGNKTIEAEVSNGKKTAIASAPSGVSVGKFEVPAFPKAGVSRAVKTFNSKYRKKFLGLEANYHTIDSIFSDIDPKCKILGGNLHIAVSLATAKLQALEKGKELYELFGKKFSLPFPLGNILGGGMHTGKGAPEFQEFLSIPFGAKTFKAAAFANALVHKIAFSKLHNIIRGRNDEGAWASSLTSEHALQVLTESCAQASSELNFEIRAGLDVAASQFYDSRNNFYHYRHASLERARQISHVAELTERYNLYYIEDALEENDFEGFALLNKQIGKHCLVCGDDLVVTNTSRLETALSHSSVNAVIVKPNQIGSLTATESFINTAVRSNCTPVISHRSGETSDTSITHLAVGFSIPIIKCGAVGGERTAKLNELIRIEERTGARMAKLPI